MRTLGSALNWLGWGERVSEGGPALGPPSILPAGNGEKSLTALTAVRWTYKQRRVRT